MGLIDLEGMVEIDWMHDCLEVCVATGYEYEPRSLTADEAETIAAALTVAAVRLRQDGPARRAAEEIRRRQDTGRVHGPEVSERMAYERASVVDRPKYVPRPRV